MFTLLKFLFKLVLTVQIFNWMLAEADLFLPGVQQYASDQLNTFQIPTHDRFLAEGDLSFGDVGKKLDGFLASLSIDEYKAELSNSISGSSQETFQELKQFALNKLPLNTVEILNKQELSNALAGGESSPWQEF